MARLNLTVVLFVIFVNYYFANGDLLTWNMQGAGGGGGLNKWAALSSELRRLSFSPIEVVALQECGAVPGDAQIIKRRILGNKIVDFVPTKSVISAGDYGPTLTSLISTQQNANSQRNLPYVREFTWRAGTSSYGVTYYVYHLSIDDKNQVANPTGRTNMAIVSRSRANEVIVFSDTSTKKRPIFGIRIGTYMYFNVHAPAYSNNQINKGLTLISEFISNNPGNIFGQSNRYSWIFMGDFNREDVGSVFPPGHSYYQQVIKPRVPTHVSGKTLDYAVLASSQPISPYAMAFEVLNADHEHPLVSDHVAVRFIPVSFLVTGGTLI